MISRRCRGMRQVGEFPSPPRCDRALVPDALPADRGLTFPSGVSYEFAGFICVGRSPSVRASSGSHLHRQVERLVQGHDRAPTLRAFALHQLETRNVFPSASSIP